MTTQNKLKRQTDFLPAGIEPAISASEWPQTHVLNSAATMITIYLGYEHLSPRTSKELKDEGANQLQSTPNTASTKVCEKKFPVIECFDIPPQIAATNSGAMSGLECTCNAKMEKKKTTNWKPPNRWLKINFLSSTNQFPTRCNT
jgi:hypothetical protein